MEVDVRPGTVTVFTDVVCGWSTVALHRFYQAQGSPHFFLADGSDVHNPGIELHWQGDPGAGFPVVDDDDPGVYDDLVQQAAKAA